ncbi:MAG: SET domain-containing protein [bacterium]|nr:SET domain-containing protein [bacterium]MDZ4299359.1 SET domain-containing protein [Candidatus Sungbacteria bacterium]
MAIRSDKRLLRELNHIAQTVYCQLKPSPRQGVGVFAIHDIPARIEPFEDGMEKAEKFYRLPLGDLDTLPPHFAALIKNYSVREKDAYWVSLGSWNTYALQDFLNHSATPNVATRGEDRFVTMRKIKAGEELLANYKTFDDSWAEKLSPQARGIHKSPRGGTVKASRRKTNKKQL